MPRLNLPKEPAEPPWSHGRQSVGIGGRPPHRESIEPPDGGMPPEWGRKGSTALNAAKAIARMKRRTEPFGGRKERRAAEREYSMGA